MLLCIINPNCQINSSSTINKVHLPLVNIQGISKRNFPTLQRLASSRVRILKSYIMIFQYSNPQMKLTDRSTYRTCPSMFTKHVMSSVYLPNPNSHLSSPIVFLLHKIMRFLLLSQLNIMTAMMRNYLWCYHLSQTYVPSISCQSLSCLMLCVNLTWTLIWLYLCSMIFLDLSCFLRSVFTLFSHRHLIVTY